MTKILTLTVALFTAACATTGNIGTEVDKFTGGRIHTSDNISVVERLPDTTNVKTENKKSKSDKKNKGYAGFDVRFKKQVANSETTYEIVVVDGGEFRFPISVRKEEGLQFNVDGEVVKLSTTVDSASTEFKSAGILAARTYQVVPFSKVPESLILKLATAKEVKVRIQGTTREKSGYLDPIGKQALTNLIAAQ